MAKRSLKDKAQYLGVGKKGLLRLGKQMIVEWLKLYFEDESGGPLLWEQLKFHAEAREWRNFANVITREWRAQRKDKDAVRCLDNSMHCMNIWELLNA